MREWYRQSVHHRLIEAARYSVGPKNLIRPDKQGSTSLVSDSAGDPVSGTRMKYAPFGEVLFGEPGKLTDRGFTGQIFDGLVATGGLMFYGARYYLPGIKRFISPDTIVPGATNAQAYNRYSYVFNNPLKYTDPSGHMPVYIDGVSLETHLNSQQQVCDVQCQKAKYYANESLQNYKKALAQYGVTVEFDTGLSVAEQLTAVWTIHGAVDAIGESLYNNFEFASQQEAFTTVFGESNTFVIVEDIGTVSGICEGIYGCNDADSTDIYLQADALLGERNIGDLGGTPSQFVAHELAHNLTNGVVGRFTFRPTLPGSQPSADTTQRWLDEHALFGVGCYAYCAGVPSEFGYDDEMTADAIANYLMVQADDDTGQLRAFISGIVTCQAGGC